MMFIVSILKTRIKMVLREWIGVGTFCKNKNKKYFVCIRDC